MSRPVLCSSLLSLMLGASMIGVKAQVTERVVFARPDPLNPTAHEIWIMDPLGGNQQQLTNNLDDDVQPKLCGSNKIVFASNRDGGDYDIWIMNRDGSGAINLTPLSVDNDFYPDCDNAGTLLPMVVFESDTAEGEIFKVSSGGGLITRLTNDFRYDANPSWCGSDIAFIKHDPNAPPNDPLPAERRRKVFLMDAQGGNLRQLTGSDTQEQDPSCNATVTEVTWASKDWVNGTPGHFIIYKCSLASPTETDCLNSRVSLTDAGGDSRHPVFSPGGLAIVFSSNRPSVEPADGTTDFEIYQMSSTHGDDPSQGFLHQLTAGPDPAQQNDDIDPDWAEAKGP